MVVDTSVWIDYFNNHPSWQARRLTSAITDNEIIVLPDIILTEILLGLSSEYEAQKIAGLLSAFDATRGLDRSDYQKAAKVYRTCRKNGKTIRSTIDCLIATTCLKYDFQLLSKDRDFNVIAQYFPLMNIEKE